MEIIPSTETKKNLRSILKHNKTDLGDIRCGTVEAYLKLECKCLSCKKAWASYQTHRRKTRAKEKLASLPPDMHGTVNLYQNWCCRCKDCKKAWAFFTRMKRLISITWAISPLKALELGGPPVKNASQWQP